MSVNNANVDQPQPNTGASRLKISLFFIIPCVFAFASYYKIIVGHFPSQTVSWQDLFNNNEIVAVEQIQEKQFQFADIDIRIKRGNESIGSDILDVLLIQWGIDPKGMDPANIKQKIDLLLTVSAPDFWRKNYLIHPNAKRVTKWLSVHKTYLNQVQSIKNMSSFIKLSNKVKIHTEYEELMLYKFIADNLHLDVGVLELEKEHGTMDKIANNIRSNVDGNDCDALLLTEYEKELISHFRKEEQNIVHVMLNANHTQYKIYKESLTCSRYHPDKCAYRFI